MPKRHSLSPFSKENSNSGRKVLLAEATPIGRPSLHVYSPLLERQKPISPIFDPKSIEKRS